MPQSLLLPMLAGVAAGLAVCPGLHPPLHPESAAQRHRHPGRGAGGGRAAARWKGSARPSRPSPSCCSPPRWRRSSCGRISIARSSAAAKNGSGWSGGRRSGPGLRSESWRRSRPGSGAAAHREETLGQREQALRRPRRRGRPARPGAAGQARADRRAHRRGCPARDLQRVEDEARSQAAALVRDIKEQARRTAEREARRIIAMAIQRLAAEHTAESTVSAVALPERRDEGPDHRPRGPEHPRLRDRHRRRRHHRRHARHGRHLLLRSDPPRGRAPLARGADRRRPHPSRAASRRSSPRSQKELETQLVETGEQAAYDTGVHGLHPELIKLIGRMR